MKSGLDAKQLFLQVDMLSNKSCKNLSCTSFFNPPKNVHLKALLYVCIEFKEDA